jgi:hypothetical protein
MEDVLEVYQREREENRPLVCLDEFSKQLLGEVSEALPARPGLAARHDSEYVRHGSVSAFLIYAPLEGSREVYIGPDGRRTTQDYARVLEFIATRMFPNADKIVLVEDNLNTHCDASLYATFPPHKARELARRFERHHTPKHGSWLNIAESEISAIVRTGLAERIESKEDFRQQVHSVTKRRNNHKSKTNWQFTNEDARIKLRSLYPSIQF